MNKYKQVFRLRVVHLMSIFLFLYVGVEVCIGGWIVTFVINERSGGRNSGYVSSGFWGGLTLGRIVLLPLNKKVSALFILRRLEFGRAEKPACSSANGASCSSTYSLPSGRSPSLSLLVTSFAADHPYYLLTRAD